MMNTIVQKFGERSNLQQTVHGLLMAQYDYLSSQLWRLVWHMTCVW